MTNQWMRQGLLAMYDLTSLTSGSIKNSMLADLGVSQVIERLNWGNIVVQ